ncbi:MAG: hypothetical protein HN729_11685 [Candidatus Marinimicrobia bacterium]|jgi:predicted negative regulator of RcsB-dependent stress response|nr:hypothetical protein [Candidatus Neomarinimicrobiota bacterium]MBT3634419.1 hypothetical protein [Candidatus Neomarinimicrobiota bacterium]MBT3683246.1 hypothetical protein [Candidatus Neomarinimicrobiota bacterium]MBT3760134.1 hypothetical protein [Candidatus Neomarinimicrobiota bacterium]MBT3896229.1 hypothetical protein [Candidatus Neomarinimicrobiota bacterium]
MAHKEEFKHDAVRENLVKIVGVFRNNKSQILQYGVIAIVAFSLISWYVANKKSKDHASIVEFGKAVNLYIDGESDLAMIDIQSVADNYDGSQSADHARIFLIQEAMKNKDYDLAKEEADKLLNNTSNDLIISAMWSVKGDIAYNQGDFDSALHNYQKAADSIELKSIADSYRVNAARVYMEKKNYADAKQVLDSVLDNSDLRFNVKNIAEDLLAEVNYHLN